MTTADSSLAGRARLLDVALLVLAKASAMAWVLRCGFVQVSDDDHSRVVIAEQFAHTPKLDPSGTSWLPFPFWIHGATMAMFGRSLTVAHATAFVIGAAVAALPYLVARRVGVERVPALIGAALFALTPWSVWLGVAPVPEAFVGALLAAGLLALRGSPALAVGGAVAILLATLSRYDAWAAAAFAALALSVRAVRERPRRGALIAAALLAALGPLAWMAWNHHAHGSATHFVDRVAMYRRSIGAASAPLADKLTGFPRAVWSGAPELVVLFVFGSAFVARRTNLVRRWSIPVAAAALTLAFLVYGDVRDGAPTHHSERAIVSLLGPLAGVAGEGVFLAWRAMGGARRALRVALPAVAFVSWCYFAAGRWSYVPGRDPSERRDAQIAKGAELRARGVERVVVEPCQYEHFALIAAFGAPEKVTTLPASRRPVDATCPVVREE